jgi:two-component system, NtrC family, sensor kinase
VLTFAHLLLRRFQNDEKTRKDLDVIIRETTRIKGIVQGILDFGRETPMERKPRRIEEILHRTLELIVHQERFFGVTLEEEYDTEIPSVVVDGSLIQQVFMNIILNGLDAMKGHGTLTIRTRQVDRFVEIDIQDTGDGILGDIVGRIFDPFFTTKNSTEGMVMGLGLAVSYGIFNNHNGDIQVTSKVGQGTLFTIRLPLEE